MEVWVSQDKKNLSSLSLPPSLPAQLPLPGREAVSLCERAQQGRKKRNCPSSSAEPRGLSAEDSTADEEREAYRKLPLKEHFNPSDTELPTVAPSL